MTQVKMHIPLSWDTAIALSALDLLGTEQIAVLATETLGTQRESPAIRQITSVFRRSDDLRHLFAVALEELHINLPSRPEAARAIATVVASKLLAENGDPFEAARTLATVSRAVGPGFHDLDAFVYAESEAEDRPQERDVFAQALMDEARRWAGRADGRG